MKIKVEVTQKDIDVAVAMYKHTGDMYVSPLSIAFSKKLKKKISDGGREYSYPYTSVVILTKKARIYTYKWIECTYNYKFNKIKPKTFTLTYVL